jgi:hypothetical protein
MTKNDLNDAAWPIKSTGFAWYSIWWMALTRPGFRSYTLILNDSFANATRACWWVFAATVMVKLISMFTTGFANATIQHLPGEETSLWLGVMIGIVSIPFAGGGSVLAMLLGSLFANLFAKIFGGTGTFGSTVYLTAAYVAPISIIVGVVSLVPAIAFLFIPLGVYVFRLQVAVIQAAHRLTGIRSSVVVLIPTLLFFLLAYVFSLVANFIANLGS